MKLVIVFLIFLTAADRLYAQGSDDASLQSALEEALHFKNQGDLLYAAKILQHIVANSQDSLLIAESLYRIIEVGRAVETRMNRRLRFTPDLASYKDSTSQTEEPWWRQRFNMIDRELEPFYGLGIDVNMNRYASTSYLYDSRAIAKTLMNNHPQTQWAESAHAERLWILRDYKLVIEEGESFLNSYPQSHYRYSVYGALGCAYTDRWVVEAEESEEFDEYREKAIGFYKKAMSLEAKIKVATFPKHIEYEKVVSGLEEGGVIHVCFVLL